MQPSIDLVHRVSQYQFKRILDVGCGTGMSTMPLVKTWEGAQVIGVDLSEEMLAKARQALPEVMFVKRDCAEPLLDMGTFDLIFTNALIQWLPDQEAFMAGSLAMLNAGGVFAAQIPLFGEMPASTCIDRAERRFADKFHDIGHKKYVLHTASEYYDMLARHTGHIEMWVTDYCHEMDGVSSILEFLRGTALHPYIEQLDEEGQPLFMDEVLRQLEGEYHCQENGKVLFLFKRLFLIAKK